MSKRNYPEIAEQFIARVMSGEEVVSRKVRLAVERHLRDLGRSLTEKDYPFFYDPTVDGSRVCKLFENIQPSKTRSKMEMQPWMVACTLILYGWKRKAGVLLDDGKTTIFPRRFVVAFLDWARKTGKSAYLSVLSVYHLTSDGEYGPEVYSAALVEKQARRVFDEAVAMVDKTPLLRKLIKQEGQSPCRLMRKIGDHTSEFRPLSREKDAIQGTFPSFAACDELHVWKGRGPWDDIRYGMTARVQPLIVGITTAPDADDTTSIANTLYHHSENVLNGVLQDDAFFCWIAELDPEVKNAAGEVIVQGDRWDDESTWVKACPNIGVTVKWEAMRQLASEAKSDKEALRAFKKYSLNMRVESAEMPIAVADWDACARPGDPTTLRAETLEKMAGRICFTALDLALTDDTSSLGLVFPPVDGDPEREVRLTDPATGEATVLMVQPWHFFNFYWIPAENIQERVDKHLVPYDVWRDQGFLITTPGKVTDYDYIAGKIMELTKRFDVRELAYDPALASGLIKKVLQNGFKKDRVVKFAQTMLNYAAPCGDFVRAIARKEIAHDGDPVTRWQISNLRWKKNFTGLIHPDKDASKEKIDGVAADIMAWGRGTHPDNAKLLKKPRVTVL